VKKTNFNLVFKPGKYNEEERGKHIIPIYNVDTHTGALLCAGTPRPTTREQAEVNRKHANLPPLPKL